MSKLKIYTSKQSRWNTERILPELGLVKFDELGYAELSVSDLKDARLLETIDVFIVDDREKVNPNSILDALVEAEKPKEEELEKDEDNLQKVEENGLDEQTEQNDIGVADENQQSLLSVETKEKLKEMDIDQLNKFTAQFPDIFDPKKVATLTSTGKLRTFILSTFKKLESQELIK